MSTVSLAVQVLCNTHWTGFVTSGLFKHIGVYVCVYPCLCVRYPFFDSLKDLTHSMHWVKTKLNGMQ